MTMPAKESEQLSESTKIGSLKVDGRPILGVKWSRGESVAIMTNKNVCIATLNYRSHGHLDSPLFDISALSVPESNRSELFNKQWKSFVSTNNGDFQWPNVVLNRSLMPNKSFHHGNVTVIDVQWPPTATEIYQRATVAVNSADHSLYLHEMVMATGKWSVLVDLTSQLCNHLLPRIDENDDYDVILPKLSIASCVWLSQTFLADRLVEETLTHECHLVSFLIGVTLSGSLVVWKIEWTQTECCSTIIMETDLKHSWPKKMLWLEKSPNDGMLVIGFASGVIIGLLIKLSSDNVVVTSVNTLWSEEDEMIANHMAPLCSKGDVFKFAVSKSCCVIEFTVTFEPDGDSVSISNPVVPFGFNDDIICLFCKDGKTLFAGDCHGMLMYSDDAGETVNTYQLDVQRGHLITGADLSYDSSMILATNISGKLILDQELVKKADTYVQACLYHFPPVKEIMKYHLIDSQTSLTGLKCEVLRLKTIETGVIEESVKILAQRPFTGNVSAMELQKQIAANRLVGAQTLESAKADENNLPWLETSLFVNSCATRLKLLLAELNGKDWTTIPKTDIACLLRFAISIQKSVSNPSVWKDIISPPASLMHCIERSSARTEKAYDLLAQESDRLLSNLEELCSICESKIMFESPDTGVCSNGHSLRRCCLTLAINDSAVFRQCCNCGRLASTSPIVSHKKSMLELLQCQKICPMCSGHLVNIKIS